MAEIVLSGPTDIIGWSAAAARLLAENVHPSETEWGSADEPLALLAANDIVEVAPPKPVRVLGPKRFMSLAQLLIQHRHVVRFALLYRLLWRLRERPELLDDLTDSEVLVAEAMRKSVRDDIELMKSSLTFEPINSGHAQVSVAWFEPQHHILEATAPFFVRRYADACWSILTPRLSAHWNGRALAFGQGTCSSAQADTAEVLPLRSRAPWR